MGRAALEQQLQETRDRIAKGERRIMRQWKTILELERNGHNADSTRKVLDRFLQLHQLRLDLRDRIIKRLEAEEPQAIEGAT